MVPNFAGANYNLGACSMKNGDYAGAIPYLEAAIRAQPDYTEAHLNLARSLSRIPGRANDAVLEYDAAARLTPDDPAPYTALGELLASLGRTGEAIARLEEAQRIHPDPELAKILGRLRAGP
jgi:tetratricopeptide (TPR) repeat protein